MTQNSTPPYIEIEKRIDKVRDEYALVEGHFDTSEETSPWIPLLIPAKHGQRTADLIYIHAIWQLIFSYSTILIFISKSKE